MNVPSIGSTIPSVANPRVDAAMPAASSAGGHGFEAPAPSPAAPREASNSLIGALERTFHTYESTYAQLRTRFDELHRRERALIEKGHAGAGHPEWVRFNQDRMQVLFELQSEVQRSALGVEMAAKVIEHATSGARTVLQTQA